jgi:hypothetical protein
MLIKHLLLSNSGGIQLYKRKSYMAVAFVFCLSVIFSGCGQQGADNTGNNNQNAYRGNNTGMSGATGTGITNRGGMNGTGTGMTGTGTGGTGLGAGAGGTGTGIGGFGNNGGGTGTGIFGNSAGGTGTGIGGFGNNGGGTGTGIFGNGAGGTGTGIGGFGNNGRGTGTFGNDNGGAMFGQGISDMIETRLDQAGISDARALVIGDTVFVGTTDKGNENNRNGNKTGNRGTNGGRNQGAGQQGTSQLSQIDRMLGAGVNVVLVQDDKALKAMDRLDLFLSTNGSQDWDQVQSDLNTLLNAGSKKNNNQSR